MCDASYRYTRSRCMPKGVNPGIDMCEMFEIVPYDWFSEILAQYLFSVSRILEGLLGKMIS